MEPLVSAMFSASLKFMAKLKVSIYFSVQLKFCIFQCDFKFEMFVTKGSAKQASAIMRLIS